MLNKILAILLLGITMVHGGRGRVEFKQRNGHRNQMDRPDPELSHLLREEVAYTRAARRSLYKECKASEHLPVCRSLMKNVSAI